ncbi:unnamed protein product [Macrosiphum euphorbiae]|uniref:Odorant receptor n=1 Tax=Macrosiphum euphorbiae TaxID=13131 RepID=A0AAV0X5I1_9HEMI|nr:unnamed protein product [Macrosiphum euphorbiae]
MSHTVEHFIQKTGRSDVRRYATICVEFFTYCDLVVTLFFAISACLSIVYSEEDHLSNRVYGFLWLFVEIHVFALIVARLYHQSQCRDMYDRSQLIEQRIPENYRRTISMVIVYYCIMSTVHVTSPLLYMIFSDSAQVGDPFGFPFADVLPIKTTNPTVYVCKYIVYTFPVYLTHLECCFMNVTFMYFTGVVKRHFQVLDRQVLEAVANEDEQKFKMAIKHHQESLKFFKEMETVYEKPILMTIEFCGLYIGLTSYIMIQCIQGVIHPIILALCIASSTASLITISIYCVCGSNLYDLHDGILNSLFEQQSCYSRNKSLKHLILMMMKRATIPLELKAGSIFKINLNLLVKILKFTYTVFNLLLTSVNRQIKETAI